MKRLAALLAALAVICAFAPATGSAKSVVFEPPRHSDRAIVFVHGAGGTYTSTYAYPLEILARGYAVASTDAYGPFTWGNRQSVQAYENLIRRLRKRGYEKIFLLGGSMGGLATMQLIERVDPTGVILVAPVCDVSHLHPRLQPYVDRAYPGYRPRRLSPVIPHPQRGLPVWVWHSREDTWVPSEYNADACARELRARGAKVQATEGAGDHDGLQGAPTVHEILRFFGEAAR